MTASVGSEVAEAGDEVARLYTRYAPKLRRFCLGRLRSAEDADDAVQTVFLRAYTALRGGTAPVYEAAWLYKIAHNVCLSRLESGAARSRVEELRDLDLLQDVLAAPTERRDELAGLADALAAMPPNLRQAILLREWQGLSYREIAEALEVSVSAVETLIFRARRHLAAALERGVAAPARSLAAVLQVPWLLRRLRAFLASGRGAELGAAKLTATAVAAATVAGGGVATGVLASRGAPPDPSSPAPAAAAGGPTAAVAGARTPIPQAVPTGSRARRPSAHAAAARTTAAAPTAVSPFATAGPAQVVVDTTGTRTRSVDGPRSLPAPPSGAVPAPPAPATPVAVTTAGLPDVPTVSTPVGLPTAPAPTVALPKATLPVPTVSVPAATTTTVALPVTTVPATTLGLAAPPLP